MVEAHSGLSQGSDRGAGKGKDAQGRGTSGSVVQGVTPAVGVTAAAKAGSSGLRQRLR